MGCGHVVASGTRDATYCGVSTSYKLQAASRFKTPSPALPQGEGALSDAVCEPRAFRRRHHIPLTTRYESKGRTHRSAPTTRKTTSYEPQATGYGPHSAVSSFQPGGPLARASRSRPAQPPSLMDVVRSNGDDAKPQTRLLKRSWTPAFAGVTRVDARGDGRGVNNVFEPYS